MEILAVIGINIWKWLTLLLLGYIGGSIATLKIFPPKEDIDIEFGKIKFKVRGRYNTVDDILDVTDIIDIDALKKMTAKERRAAIREARRKLRKDSQ